MFSYPFQVLSSFGKRKGAAFERSISVNRKRSKNGDFIVIREHIKVGKQLAAVHEQNEADQVTWMRQY